MAENQQHSFPWIRTLAITLAIVVGVFFAGLWLINSEWLYNKIEEKIEETASEALQAEVEIDNLYGDIFSHLIIDKLSWKKAENTIEIGEIRVDYTIKEVLFGDVNVRGVYVDSVMAKFKNPNVEELIPKDNEEETDLNLVLEIFSITELQVEYQDDDYFKDSALVVNDFHLVSGLDIGETNAVTIQDLAFAIESGKLPDDLMVGLQGAFENDQIKLNDIILKVGATILNGQVDANLINESIDSRFAGIPVYQQTIATWTSQELNADDIDLNLRLEGDFSDFEITLDINSENIENGVFKAQVLSDPNWAVKKIDLSADYLNFDKVINDSTNLAAGPLELSWNGTIEPTENNYTGEWKVELANPRWNQYQLENAFVEGIIDNDELEALMRVRAQGAQQFYAESEVVNLFDEIPNWKVKFELSDLNPAAWTEDEALKGKVTLAGEVEGFGWSLPDSGWSYMLANTRLNDDELIPIEIYDQQIDKLQLSGEIGNMKTFADLFIQQSENALSGDFQAQNIFSETPQYSYFVEFDSINVGAFTALEENTTNLNGSFYGIGNGRTIETINLFGTLSITQSEINNARIDTFQTAIELDEGLLIIKEGTIDSEIADGSIKGQRNLFDFSDPDNRLSLNLELLNTQPLAGFFNLKTLQTTGTISGEITEVPQLGLEGRFNLNLNNILVDSTFQANSVTGDAILGLGESTDFDLGLSIEQPRVQEIVLQDVILDVTGQTTFDSLTANLNVTITGSERGKLIQKAEITKDLSALLMNIRFTQFDFITNESDLILQKPFDIWVTEESFGTDTLVLSSDNGAFLEFSIPNLSEDNKEIHLSGSSFDLGLIQEITLGERYLDGLLSGDLNYEQQNNTTTGNGNAVISEINYKETLADSLVVLYEITDQRLKLETALSWDGREMITGTANVPFITDPEELDDEFFSRPVEGSLEIQPTNLERFKQLLTSIGIENTTGIASVESSMSGTAGTPIFTGQLSINDPVLSGIDIDDVITEIEYSAERQMLDVHSKINAANTIAAEITVAYPFEIDFRTFEFKLPDEDDQLEIKVVSNKLNLALFDDFLDQNYVKGLNGELNADIELIGALSDIQPNGFINIKNAGFEVPFSGIKLRNINSQINVNAQKLNIERIYAESGRGRFSAKGTASLDGLTPSNIDIKTDARLFEVSNTRDMKLVIDLDAAMKGELLQPKFSGDLIVNNGYYYLSNFGEEAIEEVELDDEGIESFAPFDSLTIDMSLELRRDFYIRSRDYLDLQLEPIGTLEIAKERDEDIRLFGSLNADQGYIRPLGKRFEIERGTFQFIGEYDNPELDIRSAYVPQTRQKGESVILYYVITGTAEEPEFSFESEPEMEQSDVICYTLFNKPCYSLDSWQSVLAEGNDTMAFQALADVLLDQVESIATRELGVDVVQIDNSGQNGATAIRTGWYLNERTFFAIINEITSSTPKTLFVLEYILNENWDLIITQGDDSRQGIDVRYQFDY